MNKEKFRELFKKLRDFVLCCKKTINEVDDIFEDIEDSMHKPKVENE